jgi:ribosomal protein S21
MTVKVVKNDKESVDRVISRFNKKVQASRILLKKRTSRYFSKDDTKRITRRKAVKREEYRAIREKNRFA